MNKTIRTMERAALALAAFGFCVSAHAAKNSNFEAPPAFEGGFTAEEFQSAVDAAKKGARRVANTDSVDEATALSEQFRNIRNAVIGGNVVKNGASVKVKGAQSADELTGLIAELDANWTAGAYTETDARMLAAQLLMLKPFRGFVARARPIFEQTTITGRPKARLAHATAITALRTIAAGIETYLPTDQWKAGFAYATEPTYAVESKTCAKQWGNQCDIKDNDSLQSWLRLELLPQVVLLNNTLAGLKFDKPVYWDNQLVYGSANYTSSADRFLRLGEAERRLMLSGTAAAISSIYGVNAFDLTGWLESFDSVAAVYGFESVFRADAATSEQRFNVIKRYTQLFRYRGVASAGKAADPVAQTYMQFSYKSMKASLQNAYVAFTLLNGREGDTELQKNLIDPRVVTPFNRILNTGFQNLFAMVPTNDADAGKLDVVSAVVAGDKVTVNLKAFFDSPPASLQDFMPVGFEKGPRDLFKDVDGQRVAYRNYKLGRPIAWRYDVYARYFPGVKGPDDVRRVARVLAQSWGGIFLGLPLSAMML